MHFPLLVTSALIAGALAALSTFTPRAASCGETNDRICYGLDGGDSQSLDPKDIKYVAEYLRFIGDSNQGAAQFWNMPEAAGCAEWTLPAPGAGSVLALAKHNNPKVNSSILYEDLARAIDGGKDASEGEEKKSLLACGTHGGQYGVRANLYDPLYHTEEYIESGAVPEGILIKLVHAPPKVSADRNLEL